MKQIFILLISMILSMNVNAQNIVKLWEQSPPTNNGITEPENWNKTTNWAVNVSVPELHIYKATENKDGKVVIVCPGGGYAGLSMKYEGQEAAEWLNSIGITAVLLKYRMPNKNSTVPLEDGQQAMRYVRENATELGINPNKVGIMGFSAGGHLASTVATHYSNAGKISTRPDFCILVYPVITMKKPTHGGTRLNLLGKKPTPEDIALYSNEDHVNKKTPPTILLLSNDDNSVDPSHSVRYYNALIANNILATMYIFPVGGHGWGFNKNFRYYDESKILLGKWLNDLELKD